MKCFFATSLVLLSVAVCRADPPITVRDEKLNFTIVLPDGFVPAPDELRTPGFPYNYVRDAQQPERMLFIRIRGTGVSVKQDEMTRDDLADIKKSFPGVEISKEQWKTFNLDGARQVSTDESGHRWVQYAVGIPLQGEAVLLIVSGPENREAEVKGLLKEVLGRFEGTPGWPISNQRQTTAKNGFVLKNKHLVLAGLGFLVVLFVVWRRRRRRRARLNVPIAS
ncbi:MAG: hypothetical protein C0467_16055 [Planctomycetaceae bacterium]|nr:hypothetical protein [Planctomycetaceae bacterium]